MNTLVHNRLDAPTFKALAPDDVYPRLAWTPQVSRSRTTAEELPNPFESETEGVRCIQGVLVSIGMEAVAVFSLYGLWRLWHFFR
jgi:hypothetical protein